MKHIFDEVRYTPEGYELRHGQKVWTRKLINVAWVAGEAIKERYGYYSGYMKKAAGPYKLRYLRNKDVITCVLCKKPIHKGELCAARKYCLDCVLPFEPEREFIPDDKQITLDDILYNN